jgi:hypothetical protein
MLTREIISGFNILSLAGFFQGADIPGLGGNLRRCRCGIN